LKNTLSELRKAFGVTLGDMAGFLNLSLSLYAKIESGQRNLPPGTGGRLAKLLKCQPADVLSDFEEVKEAGGCSGLISVEEERLSRLKALYKKEEERAKTGIRRKAGLSRMLALAEENPDVFTGLKDWNETARLQLKRNSETDSFKKLASLRKRIIMAEAWINYLKNPDNQHF